MGLPFLVAIKGLMVKVDVIPFPLPEQVVLVFSCVIMP